MSEEARPFEEIYRELEETVQRLENGELSLAESLAMYERCSTLAEQCNALLDTAELRVRQLAPHGDGSFSAQMLEGWQSD